MTNWVHRNIIVPAAYITQARQVGEALTPAASGMYQTPLSANGLEPATHYISTGRIDELMAPLLADAVMLYQQAVSGAASQGITFTVTQEVVTTLVAQSDVSDGLPQTALTRLGLQIITKDTA